MIDLYTWSTPNGRKISIALEEMELAYQVRPINIGTGEQFAADFLKISPNNKIPAIIDRDAGLALFESGAILMYLADRAKRFFPPAGEPRLRVIEWLMWQMSAIGPMLGRAHSFLHFNPGKAPYAEQWFVEEARRLYGVLDRQLAATGFLAGEYSIADIATFPWIARHEWQRIDLSSYPNVKDWYLRLAARPPVVRGYAVPDAAAKIPLPST
jgi:GST-like protein